MLKTVLKFASKFKTSIEAVSTTSDEDDAYEMIREKLNFILNSKLAAHMAN